MVATGLLALHVATLAELAIYGNSGAYSSTWPEIWAQI